MREMPDFQLVIDMSFEVGKVLSSSAWSKIVETKLWFFVVQKNKVKPAVL